MKRYIITAVLAFGVLSSCSKEDLGIEREYPLTFSASSQCGVKGYVTGSVLYETAAAALHGDAPEKTARDIYLSAYIYPQVDGMSQTHFRGERFSYVASRGHWSHDPVYYWPLEAKMDFLALSSSSVFPEEDIEWRTTNGADQVKVVVRGDRTQDDICFASSYHQTNQSASVPLVFRHSQAWVELRLYVSEENFEGRFRLTDIKLEDVYTAGELTVTNNDGGALASWDFRRAIRSDTPFDDPYGVVGQVLGRDTSYMDMLLPEQEKKDIVIRYTLTDGGEEQTVRCDMPHNYWLQGGKYVYSVDFAPQESSATVTVTLTAWEGDFSRQFTLGKTELPSLPSATFDVSSQTSVTPSVVLPDATLATGTVVAIDWGDGNIEVKARSAGGRETFSHTYTSMYTGKVKIDVKKGLMDFGKKVQEVMDLFEINDTSKVLMELAEGFVFKVSSAGAGKWVTFSPGNLWWDGSAFHFEEHQYDYPTSWNANHVGHFKWGSTIADAVASDTSTPSGGTFFATGGVTVAGYDQEWTVLSKDDWDYIIANHIGKNQVYIAGKCCTVLTPDGFSGTVESSYSSAAWAAVEEQYGLVALPFAGYRNGTGMEGGGEYGGCWTNTQYTGTSAHCPLFSAPIQVSPSYTYPGIGMASSEFYFGRPVRLVSVL